MLTINVQLLDHARQTHTEYTTQADRYRTMRSAGGAEYRALERLGARLIALGRTLCERRGAVAVEVAFHAAHGQAHGSGGRHVA